MGPCSSAWNSHLQLTGTRPQASLDQGKSSCSSVWCLSGSRAPQHFLPWVALETPVFLLKFSILGLGLFEWFLFLADLDKTMSLCGYGSEQRTTDNSMVSFSSWLPEQGQSTSLSLRKVLVIQSCLTLSDPMDSSLPGSSVCGILQARILEWVTILFSRGSPQPRDWTPVSCLVGRCCII